jgi:hypothetical protein
MPYTAQFSQGFYIKNNIISYCRVSISAAKSGFLSPLRQTSARSKYEASQQWNTDNDQSLAITREEAGMIPTDSSSANTARKARESACFPFAPHEYRKRGACGKCSPADGGSNPVLGGWMRGKDQLEGSELINRNEERAARG